ncbi:MAG: hypothetical protein INH41_24410, partial [Myxococcaceae bacterium]|nr:hypothetical protein [Myxococcaceae bacterium]
MIAYITLALLTAGAHRDAAFEAAVTARYEAVEPGLGAKFAEATRASDEGRRTDAVALFEALVARAPNESAGLRRLAYLYAEGDRLGEGVALAERAQALEATPENDVAVMRLLSRRGAPGDRARADALAAAVVARTSPGDESWVGARAEQCQRALGEQQHDAFATCAEEVFREAGGHPVGTWLGSVAAVMRGDIGLARERLDAGRPVMTPEAAAHIEHLIDASEPFEARWGRRLAGVSATWLAVFAALALLGFALSALTMRTARRLATDRSPHPSTGARGLRAVYRGVLGVGGVFYYLSLPLVALAVVL